MTRSRFLAAFGLTALSLSLSPLSAFADDAGTIGLVLEPHCATADRTQCPVFDVADPTHLVTPVLQNGDMLDLDVVLQNGMNQGVKKIRSWLNYDPAVLEVRSVTLSSVLSAPIPGEGSADSSLKLVKIGGETGDIGSNRAAIARITFRVKSSVQHSEISFSNFREDGLGQTLVNGEKVVDDSVGGLGNLPCIGNLVCEKKVTPLLHVNPSTLTVLLQTAHSAASESNSATPQPAQTPMETTPVLAAAPTAAPATPMQPVNTASSFTLLQVQNLRITSRESSIFLGWQPLSSSELAGYNVYFSTVSGKYIQRRSIPANATSLVLRDLEAGTTYYAAIRAYNKDNAESVFSQEVSVTAGKPESASAPLTGKLIESQPVQGNPVQTRGGTEINGTTGMGDQIIVVLFLCAIVGTGFAAHRQMTLLRIHHQHVA